MNYITVDGGTTNTRISLVKNKEIVDTIKLSVGARDGMDGSDCLKNAVKQGINDILSKNESCQVEKILASGMITSEFGLYTLPHTTVPAGIKELHGASEEVILRDISDIPFVFMRGVKMDGEAVDNTDVMRGEETELMGIMDECCGECLYVLPGSHSKLINVDETGRITAFSTMLTGEMVWALSQSTILKDAVDLSQTETNNKLLMEGFKYCQKHGINEALFKCRILKNLLKAAPDEVYSFFMGVILCGEIEQIIKATPKKVVIGGKAQMKSAMAWILKQISDKEIITISEETVEKSTSLGMIKIYEYEAK